MSKFALQNFTPPLLKYACHFSASTQTQVLPVHTPTSPCHMIPTGMVRSSDRPATSPLTQECPVVTPPFNRMP